MGHEYPPEQFPRLATRSECYYAFLYAAKHPDILHDMQPGTYTVPNLENEIARNVASSSRHASGLEMDHIELGRSLLKDPYINPAVSTSDELLLLTQFCDEVDAYYDKYVPSE